MRSNLAEVLDLAAYISRWDGPNAADRYQVEFECLAVAMIRQQAQPALDPSGRHGYSVVHHRMWKVGEQAGDLLRIDWSHQRRGAWGKIGPPESPEVEWRRFWSARAVLDEPLGEVSETMQLVADNLLRLWYQLGPLMGEMERLEPRALPAVDVDAILFELHRRWEDAAELTRAVERERAAAAA